MPWRQIKYSKGTEHNRGSGRTEHNRGSGRTELSWNQGVSFEDIGGRVL